MRIHDAGLPEGGLPLVLIHGLSTSHRCWDRNLAGLGAGRRLLLVELFPRGRPARRQFSLAEAASELGEMLAGIGSCDVIGHSMGGLVALHLASRQPDLVSRLVLASTPVLREEAPFVRRVASVVASGSRSDPRSIGLVLATVLAAGPGRIAAATQATLRADLTAEAAALTQPTLLVWGSRDRLVPPDNARRLVELIPDARLEILEEAGHDAMWEAPEAFNDAVLRFLGDQVAG